MTTTDVRRCSRAAARAAFSSSAVCARAIQAPRLAALAAKSTGSRSPSYLTRPATITIICAHAFVAAGAAEAADAGEAVIVEKHDVDFEAFLERGDDFLRHHQVGAVADEHVHFARGVGHFRAEAAGDFVAHAGKTVFHVVAAGLASAPEFVQVSGQAAGRADDDVRGLREIIYDADDFALRDGRRLVNSVDAVHFIFPAGAEFVDLCAIAFFDGEVAESLLQFCDGQARVAGERQGGVFVGVEFGDINIDEAHGGILERGF